jgi:hypothetical protein
VTTLQIAFLDPTVQEVEKFISYKLQNFVSDVGGLLGLFMGCSLISIVEIFFFIIRFVTKSSRIESNEGDYSLKQEIEKLRSDFEKLKEICKESKKLSESDESVEVLRNHL